MADIIALAYQSRIIVAQVNRREYNSWQQSLNFLKNSFEYTRLTNNRIIIEYELPYSSSRIDVLLFGEDQFSKGGNVVVMELKQWSNGNMDDAPAEGNVIVDYGNFKKEQEHPSLQVQGYHYGLKDLLEVFSDEPSPLLHSCLERPHRADQSLDRIFQIPVHRPRRVECGECQALGRSQEQILVLFQKLFRDADVAIGNGVRIQRRALIVLARLLQVRAVEWAIHRDFTLGAAAERADIAVHSRTKTAWFPDVTYCTRHSLSIKKDTYGSNESLL